MKMLIIYDSKFGNNRQIAAYIANKLQGPNNVVKLYRARDLSKHGAVLFRPEILVFGGPIRAGMIAFAIRKWISGFANLLERKGMKLDKTAAWGTHLVEPPDAPDRVTWKNVVPKWEKLLGKVPAEKTLPGVMDVVVKGMEGPLVPGWRAKVEQFVEKVMNL